MKICIYGAGAIGSFLGAALTGAGYEVTLIARGAHLEAMRRDGLTVLSGEERRALRVRCAATPAEAGKQDYVILALKAHSVAPIAGEFKPMLGPQTAIVTAQNGILWWYFYKLRGPWENHHLNAADPGGVIWRTLNPERAIGCVVYPSCELVAPGVVRHIEGDRFMLGEPDGSSSARVTALAAAMTSAGLRAPLREKIRDDIWFKLLGNATFNPVSVLTSATLAQMGTHADGRSVIRQLMSEAAAVAARLGVTFPMDIERRIDGATRVGDHRTSMLQDFQQGRPLELDALVAAVTEIGRLVDVPTPALDLVLKLVELRLAVRDN